MDTNRLPLVIACIAKSPWYGRTDYEAGWYNGYVLIRKDLNETLHDFANPIVEQFYEDEDSDGNLVTRSYMGRDDFMESFWFDKIVSAYGGITLCNSSPTGRLGEELVLLHPIYDSLAKSLFPDLLTENYMLHGFDCAHLDDTHENRPLEWVAQEALDLRYQVLSYVISNKLDAFVEKAKSEFYPEWC